MPKDRPIKSFRLEGERPFKAFNPALSNSLQFTDGRQLFDQSLSVPTSAAFFMMHQQRQQQERQLLPNNLSAQHSHPVFNEQVAFQQNLNRQQHESHSTTDSSSFGFDDFDIMNSGPSQIQQSLSNPTTYQSEQFHSSSTFGGNNSFNPYPTFLVQNMNIPKMPGNETPQGKVFNDNSLPSSSNSTMKPNSFLYPFNSTSSGNSQFPQSSNLQFSNFPTSLSGVNLPVPSTSSNHTRQFTVKTEVEDDSSFNNSNTTESSNTSVNLTMDENSFSNSFIPNTIRSQADFHTSPPTEWQNQPSSSAGDQSNRTPEQSDSNKDMSYTEKRKKNNESAKRSREARRNKEEMIALHVIRLEEENMKLRAEISLLDKELDELRMRLYQCN